MSFSRANWKNFWKTLRLSTPTHSRHSHLWTFNPWTILCHLPPIRSYRFCSRPEVEAFCWQSLANLSWHIPTNSIEKNIRFCFQLLLSQWCCIILPRSESKKHLGSPENSDLGTCCKSDPWCPWPKLKNSRWMSCSSFEMPWWHLSGTVCEGLFHRSLFIKVTWKKWGSKKLHQKGTTPGKQCKVKASCKTLKPFRVIVIQSLKPRKLPHSPESVPPPQSAHRHEEIGNLWL